MNHLISQWKIMQSIESNRFIIIFIWSFSIRIFAQSNFDTGINLTCILLLKLPDFILPTEIGNNFLDMLNFLKIVLKSKKHNL